MPEESNTNNDQLLKLKNSAPQSKNNFIRWIKLITK